MWTDPSPIQAMREAIQPHIPPKAFLRRDRGEGLLVTNAPVFDPEIHEIPGFILERQGQLLRILPDAGWIARLEEKYPEPPSPFCKTFLRFRGIKPDQGNLLLCVQGLKLLDAGFSAAPAEKDAYDRALRGRCAMALRGGACGGGLYAAALILAQINVTNKINTDKGETHT